MRLMPSLTMLAAVLVPLQADNANDKHRDAVFKVINDYRAEGKVAPLVRNTKLDAVAQKHAENMAKQQKLAHELDGKRVKVGYVTKNTPTSRLPRTLVK
jgi:uncharacterized protein YkwD